MANHAREDVEAQVARETAERRLWDPGATLLVAVSGGADSLCLLGALLDLREKQHPLAPGAIVVATLDHGLRGKTGAEDSAWVATLARELGLRCVNDAVDTRTFARKRQLSLEDAGRRLRYRFLRQAAHEAGASRICLAHTLNDQAETVLLRLLRGAGLGGLAGMRPLRGNLARPLLGVTRAQTEAYCSARGWEPRKDETNSDERYLRNRVRLRLLPALADYNPQINASLARLASAVADDEQILEQICDDAWSGVAAHDAVGSVSLALAQLAERPRSIRRRLIMRAARALTTTAEACDAESVASPLEGRHVALIERLALLGETGSSLSLPGGLRAERTYTSLRLTVAASAPAAETGATYEHEKRMWTLTAPGSVEAAELGWRVRAVISDLPPGLEDADLPPWPDLPPLVHVGTAAALPRGEWRAYVDADFATGPLRVRGWRSGDRFRPLGMAHSRKLQDVFTDAKIPRALRHRLPIVFTGEGASERIIWVAGLRASDEFKLTSATSRILVLQAEPLELLDDSRGNAASNSDEESQPR
ncbi:MAG TPA: tRNA lysidine(34) synthetase TilS [Ktedonobacterales bacterium]